jgi:hypothetical protein
MLFGVKFMVAARLILKPAQETAPQNTHTVFALALSDCEIPCSFLFLLFLKDFSPLDEVHFKSKRRKSGAVKPKS